jgi:hypothetical protein
MATAFLKLFMALPPTLAALAALAVRLGLAWLEDTETRTLPQLVSVRTQLFSKRKIVQQV